MLAARGIGVPALTTPANCDQPRNTFIMCCSMGRMVSGLSASSQPRNSAGTR